ncbi:MAG: cobyric acid synthase [Chlamydiales bacterium]
MPLKPIMILGTSSDAGKTTLVAGLCRLFANRGVKVAPFKSQNMSLNSYATIQGEEIARSTAVQAIAAKQEPSVHMNPILLKPKGERESQVIIHGKVIKNASAQDYFFSLNWHQRKLQAIQQSIGILRQSFDLIIAEGAGSLAEPNFRSSDLVNMGIAHLIDADVYLVVDIAKGGAFADILGTLRILELVAPEDIKRIKGILINKFRGDRDILQPALDFTQKHTHIPITGIIPYFPDLSLEEEDRVQTISCQDPEIDIAVVYFPHIANSNDFYPLNLEQNVRVRFVRSPDTLGCPDLIILPGTKNTLWDLDYFRRIGWEEAIRVLLPTTPLMGICGGFEMMGKFLYDPNHIEFHFTKMPGLGFFDFATTFKTNKKVAQVSYQPTPDNPFKNSGEITGYEIHCGEIEYGTTIKHLFTSTQGIDGAVSQDPFVFGTFIHDIFKNPLFTRTLINKLRTKKKLLPLTSPLIAPHENTEKQFDRLAKVLEESCLGVKPDIWTFK